MNKDIQLPSQFQIGEEIEYKYSRCSAQFNPGRIAAVRFTPAKVFYDILCDIYGTVYRDIPSERVRIPEITPQSTNDDGN